MKFEGQFFESVEHAYQAAKTTDPDERMMFAVCAGLRAGEAKRLGRRIHIRPDWEQIKVDVMRKLVAQKFTIPELRTQLLHTGDSELIEGNEWNDTFWGVCRGKGQNMLGKILMEVRADIRAREAA